MTGSHDSSGNVNENSGIIQYRSGSDSCNNTNTNTDALTTEINQERLLRSPSIRDSSTPSVIDSENNQESGPESIAASSYIIKSQNRNSRAIVEQVNERDKEKGSGDRKGDAEGDAWYSLGYAIERMAFPLRILSGTDDMTVGPRPFPGNNDFICSENKNNNDNDNDNALKRRENDVNSDINSDANMEETNHDHEHEQGQDGLFLDKSLSYSVNNGGGTWTNSGVRSSHCVHRKNETDGRENLISSPFSNSKNGTCHPSNSMSFNGTNARDLETGQSTIQNLVRVPAVSKSVSDRNNLTGNSNNSTSNVENNVKKYILREEEGEGAFIPSPRCDNSDIDDRRKNNGTTSKSVNPNIQNNALNNCVDKRGSHINQNSKENSGPKGKSFGSDATGCIIN